MRWLALVALMWPAAAWGADPDGTYIILAPGTASCGKFTPFFADETGRVMATTWIAGFVTAYNRFEAADGNIAEGTDGAALVAWVEKYCRENPLDNLARATEQLTFELKRRRLANGLRAP